MSNIKAKIRERVVLALRESALNYSEIGRRLGVSPQAVHNWASGTSVPTVERINGLSDILHRDGAWLQGLKDDEIKEEVISDTITIRVLSMKASAGSGIENFDTDQPLRKIEVTPEWIRQHTLVRNPEKLRVITISGDSMMPTLEDGEFALVDTSIQNHISDSIYLAVVNGQAYVKRFQRRPDGVILMISDNKRYETFEISEGDSISVVGRLCYHWHGERM